MNIALSGLTALFACGGTIGFNSEPSSDQPEVVRAWTDDLGMTHQHLQQTLNGVPVVGGQQIEHIDAMGNPLPPTSTWVHDLQVDTTPALSPREAIDLAVPAIGGLKHATAQPTADLWILRHDDIDHLVWKVALERLDGNPETTSMPVVYIDAHTGETVFQYDNLQSAAAVGTGHTQYSGTVSLNTYDEGSTYVLEDTTRGMATYSIGGQQTEQDWAFQQTQPLTDDDNNWATDASVDAHYGGQLTLDYYRDVHGRAGIDGNHGPLDHASATGSGAVISVYTNFGSNFPNAFWTGSRIIIGHGDGTHWGTPTAVELMGHEMTHGVIQATAALGYTGESGAINEHLCDVMGAMVEWRHDGGVNSDTWFIGEDFITPGVTGDAGRYFHQPSLDGRSPDHLDDYYQGWDDNGGVHLNNGIANLAFYLAAQGGEHPTRTGPTVAGVGVEVAEQVWYRGMTTYLTSSGGFYDTRDAMLRAASDLYGPDSAAVYAVGDAWASVGVGDWVTGSDEPLPEEPDSPVQIEDACSGYDLQTTGQVDGVVWEPNGTFYMNGAHGVHEACISSSDSLTLTAHVWNGWNWQPITSETTDGGSAVAAITSSPGYFIWSVEGTGSYAFGLNQP